MAEYKNTKDFWGNTSGFIGDFVQDFFEAVNSKDVEKLKELTDKLIKDNPFTKRLGEDRWSLLYVGTKALERESPSRVSKNSPLIAIRSGDAETRKAALELIDSQARECFVEVATHSRYAEPRKATLELIDKHADEDIKHAIGDFARVAEHSLFEETRMAALELIDKHADKNPGKKSEKFGFEKEKLAWAMETLSRVAEKSVYAETRKAALKLMDKHADKAPKVAIFLFAGVANDTIFEETKNIALLLDDKYAKRYPEIAMNINRPAPAFSSDDEIFPETKLLINEMKTTVGIGGKGRSGQE